MGELLAEKARVAEEEAALLGKKASDAEEEIKRLRMCVSKVRVCKWSFFSLFRTRVTSENKLEEVHSSKMQHAKLKRQESERSQD